MEGRKPLCKQQDREIAGMVKVLLSEAVIREKGLIDHPNVHVPGPPVRPEISEGEKQGCERRKYSENSRQWCGQEQAI
jgi:hypothetical protein